MSGPRAAAGADTSLYSTNLTDSPHAEMRVRASPPPADTGAILCRRRRMPRFNDCYEPEPVETYTYIVKELNKFGLSYVHMVRRVFCMLRAAFSILEEKKAAMHTHTHTHTHTRRKTHTQCTRIRQVEPRVLGNTDVEPDEDQSLAPFREVRHCRAQAGAPAGARPLARSRCALRRCAACSACPAYTLSHRLCTGCNHARRTTAF